MRDVDMDQREARILRVYWLTGHASSGNDTTFTLHRLYKYL